MKERKHHTESSAILYHDSPNKNIKRTSSSILNHELLRLQVLDKHQSLHGVFKLSQSKLCDFFVNYKPLLYSKINLQKLMDKKMELVRLIKSINKVYFGEVKGKVRHGQGILVDDKGRIYEGMFQVNQRNGHGVEIYANGNVFLGQFLNNKKHGKGQFYWFNLSPPIKQNSKYVQFYEGSWWGGLPDGSGSHQKSNGDVYDGTFKNGLKHGQGEQYFFNGDTYKGEYVNGLPQGFGLYAWKDGSRYEGDFKQGMRSGHGSWISGDDTQTYRGPYIVDKKCGYGEYRWGDGYLYKGNFENDLRNGFGQLYERGELKYRGDWINGKIINDYHEKSSFISPPHQKLPSLKKLRPPSSAIIKKIQKRQFSPQSYKSNKSLERSRSRSPTSYGKTKIPKIKKAFTQTREVSSSKKTLKKRRPVSLMRGHNPSLSQHKFEVVVQKCTKRNCGCNLTIPVKTVKSPKHSQHEKRSLSSKKRYY